MSVAVDALHRNAVVGAMGMPTWQVSTVAEALAGFPDTAHGASPFIFAAAAFQTERDAPLYQTATAFGEGNGDVPNSPAGLRVDELRHRQRQHVRGPRHHQGLTGHRQDLQFGEYIGQHNNGNHTALYGDVNKYLCGLDVPAAIVDTNGNFMGWATFHVISASGGSQKVITGYFKTNIQNSMLSVHCPVGGCPQFFGSIRAQVDQLRNGRDQQEAGCPVRASGFCVLQGGGGAAGQSG